MKSMLVQMSHDVPCVSDDLTHKFGSNSIDRNTALSTPLTAWKEAVARGARIAYAPPSTAMIFPAPSLAVCGTSAIRI